MRIVLLWLGAAAVVLGLAFTLFPLGTDARGCGNAFTNGDAVSILDSSEVEGACAGARGDRWITITTMVGLGAAALAASSDLRARERAAGAA